MPIAYFQLIPANNASPGYAVAKELARQTVAQFGAVRGAGAGIGPGSCCAALAIVPAPLAGFPAANALNGFGGAPLVPNWGGGLPYSIVYGNSQMAPGGLVNVVVGGHAERAALTAANGQALYLLPGGGNNAVLFVELTPCAGCQNWLNNNPGAGGVPNPFNGVINGLGGTTLNVWWRWVYPGAGVAQMNAFHALALPNELADINANW